MARALVLLADGCEEMEAVIVMDTLRRAKWDVVAAGVTPGAITASRGVRLLPDAAWADVDPARFDILVIPGGSRGVDNLVRDQRVLETVRQFCGAGKRVAAVCAGPLVLQAAGVLAGKRVTSHPGVAQKVTQAVRMDEAVVKDGRIITSQGPGTSFAFALAIIADVDGQAKADAIGAEMVWRRPG
jgi:4-methyl-5(b-hydroxyethyl)-thiazole monophosphate biosynthesis